MSTITKLGQSRGGRVSVYLDEQFVCFLNNFSVFKFKLAVGTQISKEKLQLIQIENEQDTAFDLAIKYLSKYTKTEKEVSNFLAKKGFLPDVIDLVMGKIKDYKYLDDQRFAESFAKENQRRYGKNKIKNMLKNRGISNAIVEQTQIQTNADAMFEIATKYMKNKQNTFENKQKCAKFLIGRGFDWEDVKKVVDTFKTEGDDESW